MANKTWSKVRIPVAGMAGVGVGASVGELSAETIARAAAQTGWYKVGVKALVKGGVFVVFYSLSAKLPGLYSLFAEIAGYGSLGSIFNDVFYQLYPGGIWGLSQNLAMSLRGYSAMGVRRAVSRVEQGIEATAEAGSIL